MGYLVVNLFYVTLQRINFSINKTNNSKLATSVNSALYSRCANKEKSSSLYFLV